MTRRSLCAGVVVVALIAGCGGGRNDFDEELQALLVEQGIQEKQAECVVDELGDSDPPKDEIFISDEQIEEISEEGSLPPDVQDAAIAANAECAPASAAPPTGVPPGALPPGAAPGAPPGGAPPPAP